MGIHVSLMVTLKSHNHPILSKFQNLSQKLNNLKQIHHECKEIEKLEIKINEKINVKIKNIKQSMTKELTNNIKEIKEKQTKKNQKSRIDRKLNVQGRKQATW